MEGHIPDTKRGGLTKEVLLCTHTYVCVCVYIALLVLSLAQCWDGVVVSLFASHVVGCGFMSRPGHTKHHHENGRNCLPPWHANVRVRV